MRMRSWIAIASLCACAACSDGGGDATTDAGPFAMSGGAPAASGGSSAPGPRPDAAAMQQTGGSPALADAGHRDAALDADAAAEPADAVRFEPAPGTFTAPIHVALAAGGDTRVYYTLDGSLPSDGATLYTAPIAISTTTLVRVAAYAAGQLVQRQSASYVELAADVAAFDSNLPLLIVHTLEGSAPDPSSDERVAAVAQIHDRGASAAGRAALAGAAAFDARAAIKVHGRSSRTQEKLNYSLEIRAQDDSDDEQAQLLDLPPQSDWVLYGPYQWDRALIRNALWYQLSRNAGRYAPRSRFVEVYVADAGAAVDRSAYAGVYALTEAIKRDKDRVAVKKLEATDTTVPAISGGYIVRVDEPDADEVEYTITGIPEKVMVRYPDQDKINPQQTDYIEDYLDAVGRALGAADHVDPTTQQAAADLIDVDAFIDHHILSVFAKNPDAFRLSAYMYKDRGAKLAAGPLWDCDRCMGSYDGRDMDPIGWLPTRDGTNYFDYGWWGGLFDDAQFEARYWDRFAALLNGPLAEPAVLAVVDALAADLDEAAARNAARYPDVAPRDGSFRAEVAALKDWLAMRIAWMKANLGRR
jgi:hypothetical protein